ncbi:MAG: tetratricopeptide repeat protein [Xanthobacteraceae bacterium]
MLRRIHCAALLTFGLTLPQALAAQQVPTPQELIRVSPAGDYLAARHAGAERDASAAAAYYMAALRADPRNPELLNRAFVSVLAGGDIDEAVRLAERILQIDKSDRIAHLVLGVRALKQKDYSLARAQLGQSVRGPITDLAATLLTAWTYAGPGDRVAPAGGRTACRAAKWRRTAHASNSACRAIAHGGGTGKAIETVDHLAGPDWYAIFKDLHAGLILDLADRDKEAGRRLELAYRADSTALRVVEAYGSWASRNESSEEALKIFKQFEEQLPQHPLITSATDTIKKGGKLPPLIDTPQAGAAEVLYGLGASLGRRGGEDVGLVYLQLALYLAPTHPMALLSLADLYESMKKPELALKAYERVPANSPLHRNALIQLAVDLDSLDRTDEAKKHLDKLITDNPKDLEAILALGNIERGRKQFAECGETYSKAIATLGTPEKANWAIFYFRGICYERDKKWPLAEADLKKALELSPDQPYVLNYLGYSWIDQGLNLDEGMRMIRRAVEQKPDDGYIVDSLGWAFYRIGNFEDASKNLEKAVELKPEDPTINDHLGDAYWRVGRTLEARFQWAHARDLKPDAEDLPKIEQKLKVGLTDEAPPPSAEAGKAKKPGDGG